MAESKLEKWKSRALWIVIIWIVILVGALVTQVLIGDKIAIPLQAIITIAGSTTLIWMGGDKGTKIAHEIMLPKKIEAEKDGSTKTTTT